MSVNTIHLVGRAGRDPEVKYFESGSVKCTIPIAVDDPFRKAKHKRENTLDSYRPDWFDLEIWGKQAEFATNFIQKGKLMCIKGSLKFDHWEDRNSGVSRSKPIVLVETIDLPEKRGEAPMTMNNYPEEF